MRYTLRILSEEEDDFLLVIEILPTHSFQKLHELIQKICKYDKTQLSSFFICNKNWEKGEEITLIDMSDSTDSKILMEDAILKNFIKDEKQRMIYVFDFFSERGFFIELVESSSKVKNRKYPYCVKSEGFPPPQIVYKEADFDFLTEGELDDDDFEDEIGFDNIDDYDDYL